MNNEKYIQNSEITKALEEARVIAELQIRDEALDVEKAQQEADELEIILREAQIKEQEKKESEEKGKESQEKIQEITGG